MEILDMCKLWKLMKHEEIKQSLLNKGFEIYDEKSHLHYLVLEKDFNPEETNNGLEVRVIIFNVEGYVKIQITKCLIGCSCHLLKQQNIKYTETIVEELIKNYIEEHYEVY